MRGTCQRHSRVTHARALAFILMLTLCPLSNHLNSAEDNAVKEMLGGASAGGFYQIVGEAVAEMVRREYPTSSISYEPGSQAGQLARMMDGKINLVFASPFELTYANQGRSPFKKKYSRKDLLVVARIVDGQSPIILADKKFAKKNHLISIADIARVRAPIQTYVGQRGNLFAQALIGEGFFGRHGISERKISEWGGKVFPVPSQEAARLMTDRKLNVFLSASWHPDATTIQLARSIDLVPLVALRDVVDNLAEAYDLQTVIIPKGTYDFMDVDYYTVAVPSYLIGSARLSPDTVYKLVKGIYNNFEYYQSLHPIFAKFKREMLPNSGRYDLHPGARRFYREVGLLQ